MSFGSIEHGYLLRRILFKASATDSSKGQLPSVCRALPGKMELLVCAPEKLGTRRRLKKDDVENER